MTSSVPQQAVDVRIFAACRRPASPQTATSACMSLWASVSRRWAFETCMPPSLSHQPKNVESLELAVRHSSLIRMPTSACLKKPTICSSVSMLFLMSVILLVVDGLHQLQPGPAGGGIGQPDRRTSSRIAHLYGLLQEAHGYTILVTGGSRSGEPVVLWAGPQIAALSPRPVERCRRLTPNLQSLH